MFTNLLNFSIHIFNYQCNDATEFENVCFILYKIVLKFKNNNVQIVNGNCSCYSNAVVLEKSRTERLNI